MKNKKDKKSTKKGGKKYNNFSLIREFDGKVLIYNTREHLERIKDYLVENNCGKKQGCSIDEDFYILPQMILFDETRIHLEEEVDY